MDVRWLPGTLTVGLLAFLASHATLFGADHTVGGPEHWPLLCAAFGSSLGCGLFLWRLMRADGPACDGSRLALRAQPYLPKAPVAVLAAILAYGGVEACETDGHSAIVWWIVVPVIAVAALLGCAFVRAITRVAASIAIHARRLPRAERPIVRVERHRACLTISRAPQRARLFSRPPPTMQRFFLGA